MQTVQHTAEGLFKTIQNMARGVSEAAQEVLDSSPWGKMDAALKALGLTTDGFADKTRAAKIAAAEFIAENSDNINHVAESWGVLNSEVNRLAHTNLPAAIAMQEELTRSMERMGAATGQIQAAQEKTIDLMIRQKQEAGGLQTVYGNLLASFKHAYDQLGNSIAASIVQGKSFGQIWHDVLKQIEQTILGSLITSILKMAEAWVVNLLVQKATASAIDVGLVLGEAAVGGAAAMASTAAIPIVGPLLAPAAGAAMYAAIAATYVPLATFEHGGMVPDDMMAYVHKGEYISTAAEVTKASVGGGGGITLNFDGAHFHGAPDAGFVKAVMTKVVHAIRLPLGSKTNF
jgi:hypothetical protein